MTRKIVSLSSFQRTPYDSPTLIALCDDSSVWGWNYEAQRWKPWPLTGLDDDVQLAPNQEPL